MFNSPSNSSIWASRVSTDWFSSILNRKRCESKRKTEHYHHVHDNDWCSDNGGEDGCPGEGRRYHFLRGKERRERSEQLSSDRLKNGRGKSASSHAKRVYCSSGVWSVSGGGGCWWDRRHENLIVLRNNRVIGGITYRLFEDRNFVEIVFCTVATDEQIHVESNWSIQF